MTVLYNFPENGPDSFIGRLVNPLTDYRLNTIKDQPIQTKFSVEIGFAVILLVGIIETVFRTCLFAAAYLIHLCLPQKTSEQFKKSYGQNLCTNMLLTAMFTETAFLGLYYNIVENPPSDFDKGRPSATFFNVPNQPKQNNPYPSVFNSIYDDLEEHNWIRVSR